MLQSPGTAIATSMHAFPSPRETSTQAQMQAGISIGIWKGLTGTDFGSAPLSTAAFAPGF